MGANGSSDYFHCFSSNEIRAYEIEQEYLSAVQDPEPLSFYQARALRALGLLLADGTPTVGGGKTF